MKKGGNYLKKLLKKLVRVINNELEQKAQIKAREEISKILKEIEDNRKV
jgi:hypothetical protein